jgi:hypothetical protein
VEEMGSKASNSVMSMAKVLRYLAKVLVQDALELADVHPANPLYMTLLQNSQFQ